MYSTDPDKFYLNVSFLFKIACLIVAIVFHYTISPAGRISGRTWRVRKTRRVVSWSMIGVVFGGIFIEFVKEGLSFS